MYGKYLGSQEGNTSLQDDEPIGPLERVRENIEIFADNFIMQDSLKKMVEWMLVLRDVIKDPDINDLERAQALEEIKIIEETWSALADALLEKGISA